MSPHANPGVGGGVVPELPSHPNLDQLRHLARDLLRAAIDGDETARRRIGAVSDRVNLTAAQLAIAREYGSASWRDLSAEVTRRRAGESQPHGAAHPDKAPVRPERRSKNASWSAGPPITLAAGILRPHGVVFESGCAILRVGLDVSEEHPGVVEPRRARWLSLLRPALRGRAMEAVVPRLEGLSVIDSCGSEYAWHQVAGSGHAQVVGRRRIPRQTEFQLSLDPAPGADVEWIELVGPDGARTRLVRGELAEARVVGPTPISSAGTHRVESIAYRLIAMRLSGAPIGDRFLVEQSDGAMVQVAKMEEEGSSVPSTLKQDLAALCSFLSEGTGDDHGLRARWKEMLDAGGLRDGRRCSADVDVSLPAVDGVTLHFRTIVSEDDAWSLGLTAEPDWSSYSEDRQQKRTVVDIVAEDDVGGTYVSLGGGGSRTSHNPGYDVLLRFRPRMAPAAQRLRFLVRARTEQVEVDVVLPRARTT